jgi:cytochrome c biogenesis protein CcmG, thiol:disulfide interchange protein DsbE
VLVNLWATWCAPCRTELPGFQKAFERADPARLRVLGVVTEDPGLSRPLSFAVDTGVRLPSVVDDDGAVFQALGIRGLPATLFVAPDGSVTHVHNGPLTYAELGALTEKYLHVRINA